GEEKVDIGQFASLLYARGARHVLVEGGPTLFASFLEARLIDEVFLTLAPKIFGNRGGEALTMAEGFLFPPDEVSKWKLLSVRQEGDELFLRYRNAEFLE
ncbi:MAG: dihydrofolate reductase family protein, partial [Patescibacteria group bacterium]